MEAFRRHRLAHSHSFSLALYYYLGPSFSVVPWRLSFVDNQVEALALHYRQSGRRRSIEQGN